MRPANSAGDTPRYSFGLERNAAADKAFRYLQFGTCRITPGSPSRSTAVKTAPIEALARADTGGGTSDNLFYDPDDFYGAHPAGLYFLMADGSGRFIKAAIGPSVYGDLASRNGGEIVSSDAY